MTKKTLLSLSVFLCLIASIPAYASPKDELEQTQKDIEQLQEKQNERSEQTANLESELKNLQDDLVTLAGSIQKGEIALSDCEEKLRILNEQLNEKNEELKKHQKNLETLVQAALSLSHTPAEAMIMMPTNAMESIKTARALKMASDDIKKETQSIGQQLTELKILEERVNKNHELLVSKQAELDKQRHDLVGQTEQRAALLKKLGLERHRDDEKMAHLAKKAQDLKDLLSSVEEEGQKRESERESEHEYQSSEKLRSFLDAKGHIRPPVAGRVVQSFGAAQGRNTTAKGIVVKTHSGARVTAPYDGEVVFTGPFLTYGQMVIIRHSDDFHTLLAGLVKIDVSVGQFLLEGEPIGAMGDSESSEKLYIELRKDNQPVNPALWISGLKKKN